MFPRVGQSLPCASACQPRQSPGGVEPPEPGHAFQFVFASVLKLDARADQEAAHGLADQHLTRLGQIAIRLVMLTAKPPMSSARTSTSPVCTPARSFKPMPLLEGGTPSPLSHKVGPARIERATKGL